MENIITYLLSHPAYVHFPIAFTFLTLFVCIFTIIKRNDKWNSLFSTVLILTALSFLPALLTGYSSSDLLTPSQRKSIVLDLHINIMMWLFTAIWAVTLLYHYLSSLKKNRFLWAFFLVILSISIMLVYGAMLGGKLVYDFGFEKLKS